MTTVGQFPTGGALTRDRRFYWAVGAGRGINDIRIVNVAHRQGRPDDPAARRVGRHRDGPQALARLRLRRPRLQLRRPEDARRHARQGRRRHPRLLLRRRRPRELREGHPGAAAVGRADAAELPADEHRQKIAWPDRLAVSPDGSTLLVPLNLADAAAIVDPAKGSVRYVDVGHYPYGAAILPGKKFGLVSNETPGTVSVIDLQSAKVVKTIQVGAHLSHPEAIALDAEAPARVRRDRQLRPDLGDRHRLLPGRADAQRRARARGSARPRRRWRSRTAS